MDAQPKPKRRVKLHDRELARLKQRLKNARHRVSYWSGRPSMRGFGFRPGKQLMLTHDDQYELAMSDVMSLARAIERLTGKRPAATDYREEFQQWWLSKGQQMMLEKKR